MIKIFNKYFKSYLKVLGIFGLVFNLVACASPFGKEVLSENLGSPVAMGPNNSVVYCRAKMDCNSSFVGALCCAHVSMYSQGDTLRLVLPVEQFFDADNTSQIKESRLEVLGKISNLLLHKYPKSPVSIVGYTDNIGGSSASQQDISRQQAGAITAYFWNNGVPAARMTTKGRGAADPVANNNTLRGRAANNRVEVRVGLPPRS